MKQPAPKARPPYPVLSMKTNKPKILFSTKKDERKKPPGLKPKVEDDALRAHNLTKPLSFRIIKETNQTFIL
jgi:hypothetical protein